MGLSQENIRQLLNRLKFESHTISRTPRCENERKTVGKSDSDPGERRNNNIKTYWRLQKSNSCNTEQHKNTDMQKLTEMRDSVYYEAGHFYLTMSISVMK